MMILQGTFTQGENNQRILTPTNLLLFYVVDAKAPDVSFAAGIVLIGSSIAKF